MAIRKVIKFPESLLRKKSLEVEAFDKELQTTLDDMVETMHLNGGCGLAGIQIGILKRILVVEVDEEVIKVVNPIILKRSGSCMMEEGCLSVDAITVKVKRPQNITLQYYSPDGTQHTEDFTGFKARVLQHEIDHLDGKLIVDYLNPLKRLLMKRA